MLLGGTLQSSFFPLPCAFFSHTSSARRSTLAISRWRSSWRPPAPARRPRFAMPIPSPSSSDSWTGRCCTQPQVRARHAMHDWLARAWWGKPQMACGELGITPLGCEKKPAASASACRLRQLSRPLPFPPTPRAGEVAVPAGSHCIIFSADLAGSSFPIFGAGECASWAVAAR